MSGRVGAAILATILLVGPAAGELVPAVPALGLALVGLVVLFAVALVWNELGR